MKKMTLFVLSGLLSLLLIFEYAKGFYDQEAARPNAEAEQDVHVHSEATIDETDDEDEDENGSSNVDESAPQESEAEERQGNEEEAGRPDAPTNVEINGTFVSWHAVREDEIVGYLVYRGDQEGNFNHVASVASYERKTYTDPDAANHSYYVTAVDQTGQESEPSETVNE
ncbi:hypothetical protein [Shouchella shacheensis]|uniref:hypothetical protein n=1 Tax=Shouchella shacheensis TaxID=1649580 RepID=UPI0007403772|nr:hypothetical protein [Shouchella shacheensis]